MSAIWHILPTAAVSISIERPAVSHCRKALPDVPYKFAAVILIVVDAENAEFL